MSTNQDPESRGATVEYEGALMVQPWHPDYQSCTSCGGTERPFWAKGLCKLCYLREYRTKNRKRLLREKKVWWRRNARRYKQLRRRKKS